MDDDHYYREREREREKERKEAVFGLSRSKENAKGWSSCKLAGRVARSLM
jgi:hypothetical protein